MPSGSAANAASVGAKTVKGPSPCSAWTRSAAPSAFERIVKSPFWAAVVTMSFSALTSDAGCATVPAAEAQSSRGAGTGTRARRASACIVIRV